MIIVLRERDIEAERERESEKGCSLQAVQLNSNSYYVRKREIRPVSTNTL